MWDQTYLLSELPPAAETAEEVEFICKSLELLDGATVLDLCCGQGRHSQLLADKGLRVVGLDSSRFLLTEAQKNEFSSQSRMHLIEGDTRHIPLKPACDAVINLFTSFGFFEDNDNKTIITEVAAALKPSGKLLLEYWNPYAVLQLDQTRNWWWMSESLLALAEVEYDPVSGRLSDYRTVIDLSTGATQESVNHIRFYFPTELKGLLASAGLKVRAMYGDFDYSPFLTESRRLITIAEKF
jgi:SAM-dependent methyltransferase